VIIAFRIKTGCRQYVFPTLDRLEMFFAKKCYRGEIIMVQEYQASRLFGQWAFTAGDTFAR